MRAAVFLASLVTAWTTACTPQRDERRAPSVRLAKTAASEADAPSPIAAAPSSSGSDASTPTRARPAPTAHLAAGSARAAAGPPAPVLPVDAPWDRPVERTTAGSGTGTAHLCFSWRRGHASSTQCYSSMESCNAERRALPAADELSRCGPRMQAFCTRLLQGDLPGERHCFGDAARCLQFQRDMAEQSPTSPCTAGAPR